MELYKGMREALPDFESRYFCSCGDFIDIRERDEEGHYTNYGAQFDAWLVEEGHQECPTYPEQEETR